MKPNLHPEYLPLKVTCACGATYETRSGRIGDFTVDLCANCHPFFTGKQKLMDTEGRVERFRNKYKAVNAENAAKAEKEKAEAASKPPPEPKPPKEPKKPKEPKVETPAAKA